MHLINTSIQSVFIGEVLMFEAIVIGVSAGGLHALAQILPELPKGYPLAIVIVQHRLNDHTHFLAEYLNNLSEMEVTEAQAFEAVEPSHIYVAPSGYHLLIERNKTFSLNVDPPVSYSIPSIDVLFQSAAVCYQTKLIGMILTGANSDGTEGLKTIKAYGGLALVQDPNTAEVDFMPKSAINNTDIDHVIPLNQISRFLQQLEFNRVTYE
jgi:two-component system chemotaxis response regulator CheB